jgi:hypothetical protein
MNRLHALGGADRLTVGDVSGTDLGKARTLPRAKTITLG